MRKVGGILLAVGMIMSFVIACIDDSEVMQEMNPSFESLLIKMIVAMSLVIIGVALMKYSEKSEDHYGG